MADDMIPQQVITLISILGSILCIYASKISIIGGIFSIIGTTLAVFFGTNTLRHIGKYSLGTGVPSIVYMLTAVGLVSLISGLGVVFTLKLNILFPIFCMIFAILISFVISMMCKYIFKIQVEILTKSFISIALSTMLSILSMSTLIVSSYDPTLIYNYVIKNGLIILFMIITVMAIQSPYNSCMGPNEDQVRTLSLSLANAFIMLVIVSIMSMMYNSYWYIYLIISVIGWIIFIRRYFKYTKQQAASVRWSGLWPKSDGDEL